MGAGMRIAGAAASSALKCAALAVILASGTQNEATIHLQTCSTCAATTTQGSSR